VKWDHVLDNVMTQDRVFRFAPSPNGHLHLGHAASALLNQDMAKACGGRMLVRIEDIDTTRCTAELARDALEDLTWLGIEFEKPVRVQSQHFDEYKKAIGRLQDMGLVYRCSCTRSELKNIETPPDPEGQPLYPGTCRLHGAKGEGPFALRLDMAKAMKRVPELSWQEKVARVAADPSAWGDVVVARKDIGVSYHIAVVVDDALQSVTDVVRGTDLYHATSIHRVLQVLLDLPEPHYHHHNLIRTSEGEKLSKSKSHPSLRALRQQGMKREEILKLLA
jgi:glutamyl-Q tRNA(Asp) synthetase